MSELESTCIGFQYMTVIVILFLVLYIQVMRALNKKSGGAHGAAVLGKMH